MTSGSVSQVRFVFLGTGTSGGIPLIACDCATCVSTDPRDNRTRTGAAIQWVDPNGQPRTVLIDCGPDIREQTIREGLWRCDAILFTHNHVDHIFGLDEVRRFNAVMRAPLNIYAEDYVLESLRRVYKHVFDRESNTNDSFVATLISHRVEAPSDDGARAGTAIELWGLRFEPIRFLHGRLPILGWRIEEAGGGELFTAEARRRGGRRGEGLGEGEALGTRHEASGGNPLPLAYCTDVSAVPPKSWGRLKGLRTLVLDALRIRKHPTHFSLDQAVHAAEQIGAGSTYFIHMAHEIRHAEVEESLPPGIHLAFDGLALGDGDAEFFREHGRMNSHLREKNRAGSGEPGSQEEIRKTAFDEG